MGILSLLYTMAGGMEAIIWTDVVQVIVLMGGAIFVVVLLIFSIPGGLSGIISEASTHQKLSLGQVNFDITQRSEEHTSELQSLMRISYAVFCLKKKHNKLTIRT